MAIIPPKTITSMPRCKGCGTSVEQHGDLCPVCAEKPIYGGPTFTINTTPQPEPPYVRQGGYRRLDESPIPEES